MIIDYFLKLVAYLVNTLASFLPQIVLIPEGLTDSIAFLLESAYGFDWLFPVSSVIAIIISFTTVKLLQFSVILFDAVIGTIRALR